MTHCVLSVSLANGLNNATPNHAPNTLSIQSEMSNPPQQENSWNISMAMLIPPAKSNDCLPLSFSNLNSVVIGTKHTTLNIVARISNGRPSKMRSIVYLKGIALNFSRSSMVMPRLNSMCKLLMLLHLNTITQTSKTGVAPIFCEIYYEIKHYKVGFFNKTNKNSGIIDLRQKYVSHFCTLNCLII